MARCITSNESNVIIENKISICLIKIKTKFHTYIPISWKVTSTATKIVNTPSNIYQNPYLCPINYLTTIHRRHPYRHTSIAYPSTPSCSRYKSRNTEAPVPLFYYTYTRTHHHGERTCRWRQTDSIFLAAATPKDPWRQCDVTPPRPCGLWRHLNTSIGNVIEIPSHSSTVIFASISVLLS